VKWFSIKDKTKIIILINIIIILLGIIFLGYSPNNEIIQNIGAGLFASGIVAIFYLIYPHLDIEKDYLRFRKMGLINVYQRRDLNQEYSELLKKAEKQIDVLGLGLDHFREDNGKIVKTKALNGVPVRLLVIKPNSRVSSIRSYQENDLRGETIEIPLEKLKSYVIEVNETIDNSRKGNKISLKCYNAVPSTMIFRIDNIMFIGPYLHKISSRNTITYKVESDTEIFKQYEKHFNDLWNDRGCTTNFE
jgi:hypothetical protein